MVNVDTVYQTVQALANKEQRGYLTPQEFNLFANQAQQDIYEQYFYDINAFRQARPEEHEIGDSVSMIMEKLRPWIAYDIVNLGTQLPDGNIGRIYLTTNGIRRTLKEINPDEIQDLLNSKFHQKGFDDAVFFNNGFKSIQGWDKNGQITNGITCETVRGRPGIVSWGYVIVNEEPMYNPATSRNFDLHIGEQTDLVAKVLKLAGVSIDDPALYQAATAEESQNLQRENK